MTIPREWELLGANSGELPVEGAGAETVVRLHTDVCRPLAARLAGDPENAAREHVYLTLEEIRGHFDAALLRVFLQLPEGARPADHPSLCAGTLGLYGLNRASAGQGKGLESILDITPMLQQQRPVQLLDLDALRVAILPQRELPAQAGIVVGRVRLFRQQYAVRRTA